MKRISTSMFLMGVLLLTVAALLVIQKVSPYLTPGVRVEYSESSYWKEFQMVPVDADVREVYVKKVSSQSASTLPWPVSRVGIANEILREETYDFPKGAAFASATVRPSTDGSIRLMAVTTRRGITIPIFENGLTLGDGEYSIASRDAIPSITDGFIVHKGKMYLIPKE